MIYKCPLPNFPPFLLTLCQNVSHRSQRLPHSSSKLLRQLMQFKASIQAAEFHAHGERGVPYRYQKNQRRTLQPSHNFFTELRTFIPRTCSVMPFCTSRELASSIGRRAAMLGVVKAEKHLVTAGRVEGRREGNSTRAVRRRVVDGIMV